MSVVTYNYLPKVYKRPGDTCHHKGRQTGNQCAWCGSQDFTEPSMYVGVFKDYSTDTWVEKWLPESEYDELMDAHYMSSVGK